RTRRRGRIGGRFGRRERPARLPFTAIGRSVVPARVQEESEGRKTGESAVRNVHNQQPGDFQPARVRNGASRGGGPGGTQSPRATGPSGGRVSFEFDARGVPSRSLWRVQGSSRRGRDIASSTGEFRGR